MRKVFEGLYLIFGVPWVALFLFTAGSLTEVKTILLLILMIIATSELILRKLPLNIALTRYVIVFIAYCTFSFCIGISKDYDFNITTDFALIQYYLITPICVLILSTVFAQNKQRLNFIWRLLKYLTLLLVICDVWRVIGVITNSSPAFLEFIEMSSRVTKDEELTLRVRNESSLFFLLPIYLYMAFHAKNYNEKRIYIIITVLGCIYAMMSGRKMIGLGLVITFIFTITYHQNILKTIKRNITKIVLAFMAVLIALPLFLNFLSETLNMPNIGETMIKTVTSGLSSKSEGMNKRSGNAEALIDLWSKGPVLGNGLNSYAKDSLASSETKWSYEVFYIAWLAQTGIVGMFLLLMAILYVIRNLKKHEGVNKFNERIYNAIMIGFICVVIGGGTNPLLYMVLPWIIALAFASSGKNYRIKIT